MFIDRARYMGEELNVNFSPFGRKSRPFTEPSSPTSNLVVGPNKTMADLIRLYHKGATPHSFRGNFNFLDRDDKERQYQPGVEDPFIFSSAQSVKHAFKCAKEHLDLINREWVQLGLPLTVDKDRGCEIPDTQAVWQMLHDNTTPLFKDRMPEILCLISNVDIALKFSLVRGVTAGWWAVSYASKHATDMSYFQSSLSAHAKAINIIMASSQFNALLNANITDAGDPLLTNPGYPYYNANLDNLGRPTTRMQIVSESKGLHQVGNWKWANILAEVDRRFGKGGLAGHPFAVAPLRRLQPGYKWIHQFTKTASGLHTSHDQRGLNSIRVAWMVPYLYNLLVSPASIRLKTVRMMLPALYHDAAGKTRRMRKLNTLKNAGKLFMAEADYSNYDRFISVDIIREITRMYTSSAKHPKYWEDAMMYLHDNCSLIWPDYIAGSKGNGWIFKPGSVGLLSGVKQTPDEGSCQSSVILLEALMRHKKWDVQQGVDYLTQYISQPQGSKHEYYYIQSDDTELIETSQEGLYNLGNEFTKAVSKAGLVGSLSLGDRFLMRHCYAGVDRPVPLRVFQNTVSNESPVSDPLIFMVGLATRTDGLLGWKTVDPFGTGKHQSITRVEAVLTRTMLINLKSILSSASTPHRNALMLITKLIEYGDSCLNGNENRFVKGSSSIGIELDSIRNESIKALSVAEIERINKSNDKTLEQSYLYQLHRDMNIPSQALMLDEILAEAPSLQPLMASIIGKEHAFFNVAMKQVGLDPHEF